ncbi:hypothetical protein [Gracilibacillus saliphilus]|uniref:hypothetical protein n=1 Tax=Gracilibacillus saliphilus TaxID=543890 RepID=UPI001EE26657|nr:hypothetical protein [Gracilibacillus saliphilus]
MLGSILLDTFMVYPNIFHNIPESFAITMEFMAVVSPHTYFLPLGMASISTGIIAVILSWKVKRTLLGIIQYANDSAGRRHVPDF